MRPALTRRNNAILYEALLGSMAELHRFCTTNVEVIDAETDDIQISALYNMLDIPIKIYNLTNSSDEKVFIIRMPDSGSFDSRSVQRLQVHRISVPAWPLRSYFLASRAVHARPSGFPATGRPQILFGGLLMGLRRLRGPFLVRLCFKVGSRMREPYQIK